MTWPVWCPTCRRPTDHASNGAEIVCLTCNHVRPDDVPILMSQVQDMQRCDYCRETLPADHDCPAGYLAARDDEHKRDPYGSPSDLDWGA